MTTTIQLNRLRNRSIKQAPISNFHLVRSEILQGEGLEDVKRIERSIVQYGLICPIVTSRIRNVLIVIDGKKRLQAIRRLKFRGGLPDHMSEIPYISVLESKKTDYPADSIISRQHLYKSVMTLKARGISLEAIAEYLCLCRPTISDVVLLSRLSEPVRKAYFNKAFSFSVARAYASIPVPGDQTTLMLRLGASANETTILNAIDKIADVKANDSGSKSETSLHLMAENRTAQNFTIEAA